MGFLEGILYMIWRGIAIGIIISAPMGPVGILCIQRTLDKGRRAGFYTGVGAAISDLIYCLLTGFGLSFIEEFLEKNQNIIQIVGSVVLIAFGIFLFKSNPSKKLKKPTENRVSAKRNIMNGFLFTFSNPLIIFLIIGLFARFNFLLPEIKFYHYLTGFVFILVGALIWWYVVTLFVSKVRAHFNLRSMWLINKIIGSIIMVFAVFGIITAISGMVSAATRPAEAKTVYLNRHRGFTPFTNNDSIFKLASDGPVAVTKFIELENSDDFTFSFRCNNLHSSLAKKYSYITQTGEKRKVNFPEWGILLKNRSNSLSFLIHTVDNNTDETHSIPGLDFEILENGNLISKVFMKNGFDLYGGKNSFSLKVSGKHIMLRGGNREYNPITRFELKETFDSIGFCVNPGGAISIDDISIEYGLPKVMAYDPEDFDSVFNSISASADPMVGIWEEFDRTLDESNLRMGGKYRLAINKAPEGYQILYLSGALKSPSLWKKGMKKGFLYTTSFPDIYNLEWISAGGEKLSNDIKAQREGNLINIQFPYQSSSLRLRKIENPEIPN